jgi:RNA polymerase sigma-70 factor (ECF subfamily)
MLSDEALMLEFQCGSRHAFEELFGRYRPLLHAFFRRRLLDSARADDLTQDTFLAVLHATTRYEPRAAVRSYLFGIAFNLLAADRRKLHRDAPPDRPAPEPATASDSTEVLWVRQALARLDDDDRELLMLREYEQLSYGEIAGLLDIPLNTVRSRLFRARMALRAHLATEAPCVAATPIDSVGVLAPTAPSAQLRRANEEAL